MKTAKIAKSATSAASFRSPGRIKNIEIRADEIMAIQGEPLLACTLPKNFGNAPSVDIP